MLVFIFLGRFISVCSRSSFRANLTSYPTQCSSWAEESGCTRLSIYSDQCTRPETIPGTYVNSFNSTQPAMLNAKIQECAAKSILGKIQYPPNLGGQTVWQPFIHITWSSKTLGILDDVFMETYLNETAVPVYSVVNIQSQLRIGHSDFNQNWEHVDWMMKCLNNNLKQEQNTYLEPCSL